MDKNLRIFIFPLIFVLGSIKAETSDTDSIKVKYHLNPIIKTATKIAGTQRDLVASITLISGPKLIAAPTSAVLEAIKSHVPGLHVTEWGVMGFGVAGNSAGKISIRGMGGSTNTHVLILRNGRPDFMGLMGCTIADEFSTDGVERIEVLRGPASFLYGTNATGGVINIISKKMTEEGFQTVLSGGYGTFNTQKLKASHMGKIGNLEYVLTASSQKTDGHRSDANAYYQGEHYTSHIGYTLNNNTKIEFNASLANIDVTDPGTMTSPHADHWYDVKRYGGDLTLSHISLFGETHMKLHANLGQHQFYDGWFSNDRTLGAMFYQNIKPWAGNTTTLGLDFKQYGGNAKNKQTDMDYGEFFIAEYGAYIHIQQLLLGHFITSAGLRVDHHERYGNEIVPKLGMVTHMTQSTSIRLSMAKGFRSPSIRELYFFPPRNANLEPDRMWNYEIGLTQFIGPGMKCEASLFRSKGSNLIRPSNPGYPFHWVNSGGFIHTGYELMLNWIPVDDLQLNISWSRLDLGAETLHSPGKKLTANISWSMKSFTLSGDFNYIQDLYGADGHQNPMDDYGLLNLTLQTSIFSFIKIKTSVKNVLDARYQAMYGYPMPGRHVIMDLSYKF